MSDDSIEFLAKYKDWVAVKRISITPETPPEEIVLQISGIRQSVDRKSFEILGVNTKAIDEYATTLTKGVRKSFPALAETVQKLGTKEVKEVLKGATNGKEELAEIAQTYLFRRVVQGLQFDFDVNHELLQKAYPKLKIPKPLGRRPKA
ncbi:Uncharacterised protein [uncultured archaeon]|nr:Uncharacterised protein [uncultured archaeon]